METGIEHDQEIEKAFAWLGQEAGAELLARLGTAKQHFSTTMLPDTGSMLWPGPMSLLPHDDLPAGILLQAFALLRDRRYFDSRLAARTLPFFKLIGSALPELSPAGLWLDAASSDTPCVSNSALRSVLRYL